ncbi:MAG TPA: phosphatase [Actinobacteria bacterium]|nr:phosphatase [Actinomycetota bacterium]
MELVADLHVHTVSSGHAFSTVDEIARVAAEKGLKLVAITDHGPALPGGAHPYHFWNLRVLPKEIHGVRILRGAEANIVDPQGGLDLPDDLLETLDIVLVGFHPRCGYEGETKEKNTRALIGAIKNPLVNAIVHPGNPLFPIEVESVVEAAKEHGVLLEINNSSFLTTTSRTGSYECDLPIAIVACEQGLDVIISSDAHFASGVGEFGEAIRLAEEVGFTEERILNTSVERVFKFLSEKKGREFE